MGKSTTAEILNSLTKIWKRYRYRFVPWIVFNVRTENQSLSKHSNFPITTALKEKTPFEIHVISGKEDRLISDLDLTRTLSKLFAEFKNFESNLKQEKYSNEADNYFTNLKIMNEILGFSVRLGSSQQGPDAGLGVFISSGTVKAGSIVGLYPGTIYKAYEPLFFPSINNSFIFRCSDGIHIDGKSKGISKAIYKSCAARDKFHFHLPCADQSWLTPYPVNPLNTGQFVNNKSGVGNHNCVYQECFIPLPPKTPEITQLGLDIPLWKYLPNVWSNPENNTGLKVIPLVAVRDIQQGEELLSSYFTVVHS